MHSLPPWSTSHIREVQLLQLRNLHWCIIINQSPQFTLGFTLAVLHSIGLDKDNDSKDNKDNDNKDNDLYPPLQHRTERFTTLKSSVLHLLIPSSLQPLKFIDICCCCLHVFIHSVWLLTTPWTVARQAPLFMGILQARIAEWVAMSPSRGSSQPRDRTQVSHIAGGFFTVWATREALLSPCFCLFLIAMLGLAHGKSPWCWERLRAEGEEGVRGWDGWMASLMQWTWTWANFRRWWGTGRPGVLQSMK